MLAAHKSPKKLKKDFPRFFEIFLLANWQLTQMKHSDWSNVPAKSKQIEFIFERKKSVKLKCDKFNEIF